jgi:hypothetical protein
MIEKRLSSEPEMILEFVKAEGGPLINEPDLTNADQNFKRALMLDALRGYTSRRWLFRNFPQDASWRLYELTSEDYEHLLYVNSSPWNDLVPNLRVKDGADLIEKNAFDPINQEFVRRALIIRSIAQSIQAGRPPSAVLILAQIEDDKLVVIEGNHRATAFVIAGTSCNALVGSSQGMAAWANQRWGNAQ